jgi:hypothetical protein
LKMSWQRKVRDVRFNRRPNINTEFQQEFQISIVSRTGRNDGSSTPSHTTRVK